MDHCNPVSEILPTNQHFNVQDIGDYHSASWELPTNQHFKGRLVFNKYFDHFSNLAFFRHDQDEIELNDTSDREAKDV
jgi:hypothetical protein